MPLAPPPPPTRDQTGHQGEGEHHQQEHQAQGCRGHLEVAQLLVGEERQRRVHQLLDGLHQLVHEGHVRLVEVLVQGGHLFGEAQVVPVGGPEGEPVGQIVGRLLLLVDAGHKGHQVGDVVAHHIVLVGQILAAGRGAGAARAAPVH